MTAAEYKKETAWYKRFMSTRNTLPVATRRALLMVRPQHIITEGKHAPFYCVSGYGTFEKYDNLANYWVERLKKS